MTLYIRMWYTASERIYICVYISIYTIHIHQLLREAIRFQSKDAFRDFIIFSCNLGSSLDTTLLRRNTKANAVANTSTHTAFIKETYFNFLNCNFSIILYAHASLRLACVHRNVIEQYVVQSKWKNKLKYAIYTDEKDKRNTIHLPTHRQRTSAKICDDRAKKYPQNVFF